MKRRVEGSKKANVNPDLSDLTLYYNNNGNTVPLLRFRWGQKNLTKRRRRQRIRTTSSPYHNHLPGNDKDVDDLNKETEKNACLWHIRRLLLPKEFPAELRAQWCFFFQNASCFWLLFLDPLVLLLLLLLLFIISLGIWGETFHKHHPKCELLFPDDWKLWLLRLGLVLVLVEELVHYNWLA